MIREYKTVEEISGPLMMVRMVTFSTMRTIIRGPVRRSSALW